MSDLSVDRWVNLLCVVWSVMGTPAVGELAYWEGNNDA